MELDLDRSQWKRVKFGDVVNNVNENVRDLATSNIARVLGLEHLDGGELRIVRWADAADSETTFTRRVKPGQTLFGKRRAYQRKTAYAEFDAVCSGDILVFAPLDNEVLLPELLPFIATTNTFYTHALNTSAGSLSPRTRWPDIAKYEFSLPPLDQQKRIADLFWSFEYHLRSIDRTIRALKVYRSQTISHSLQPASTANGSSQVTLGSVVSCVSEKVKDPADLGIDKVLGLEHLDSESTQIKRWGSMEERGGFTKRVKPTQVLFGKLRPYQRKVAFSDIDAICSGDILVFETKNRATLTNKFLASILLTDSFNAYAVRTTAGSLLPRTSWASLAGYSFNLPSLKQQEELVAVVTKITEAITAHELELQNLQTLKKALLAALWGAQDAIQ